jgi:60kDa lysophospholipase
MCDEGFTKKMNAGKEPNDLGEIDDYIYTPTTLYNKRIAYKVLEFETLLDSSDMNADDWILISETIEENYEDFDAFIILQGTDTLPYTASALSFMLENLQKTVILTAAQIPLTEMRNDAMNNVISSLQVAGKTAFLFI